jgi:uncharacterized sulfatase
MTRHALSGTSVRLEKFGWLPLLFACFCLTRGGIAAEKPNIVFIISDDHGWTDYSFMGHAHVRTPRLDRLAGESLTFTRGYVPGSLCCPSLASLITGLYPHQHKITSNDPPRPPGMSSEEFYRSAAFEEGREVMARHLEAVPTLPRLLADHGYLSLQTGKWWQGSYRRGGFTHGMTQGDRHGDRGLEIGRETMQPIFDFVREARQQRRPFFVWYAPMMPHQPHNPPQRLLAKYEHQTDSIHLARYWAMIEWFDETVGELLDILDRQGVGEETIVVYLADNGWIQDPQRPRCDPRSKQSSHDGGLRTPIMLRWRGRIQPRRSDQLAISIDIAPTLLAALGERKLPEMQGIDLLNEAELARRDTIYGECFTHNAVDLNDPAANLRWRWIIQDSKKLIVPAEADDPLELYDLADDPFEWTNLAEDAALAARLRLKLDAWWRPHNRAPR